MTQYQRTGQDEKAPLVIASSTSSGVSSGYGAMGQSALFSNASEEKDLAGSSNATALTAKLAQGQLLNPVVWYNNMQLYEYSMLCPDPLRDNKQTSLRSEFLQEANNPQQKYTIDTQNEQEVKYVARLFGSIAQGEQHSKFDLLVCCSEQLSSEARERFFRNIIGVLPLEYLLRALDHNSPSHQQFLTLYLAQLVIFAANNREIACREVLHGKNLCATDPKYTKYVSTIAASLGCLRANCTKNVGLTAALKSSLKEHPFVKGNNWETLHQLFIVLGLVAALEDPQEHTVVQITVDEFFRNTGLDFEGYNTFANYYLQRPQSANAQPQAIDSVPGGKKGTVKELMTAIELIKSAKEAFDATKRPFGPNFFLNVARRVLLSAFVDGSSSVNGYDDSTREFVDNCFRGFVRWYCLTYPTANDLIVEDSALVEQMADLKKMLKQDSPYRQYVLNMLQRILANLDLYPALKVGCIRDYFCKQLGVTEKAIWNSILILYKLQFIRHPFFYTGCSIFILALLFTIPTFFATALVLGLMASIFLFAHFAFREQFWSLVSCFVMGAGCAVMMIAGVGALLSPLSIFGLSLIAGGLTLAAVLWLCGYKGYDNNKDDQQTKLNIAVVTLVAILAAVGMGLICGEVLGLSLLTAVVATAPIGIALLMAVALIGVVYFGWRCSQLDEPSMNQKVDNQEEKLSLLGQHATKTAYFCYSIGSFTGLMSGVTYFVLAAIGASCPPLIIAFLALSLLFFVGAFIYDRYQHQAMRAYDDGLVRSGTEARLARSGSDAILKQDAAIKKTVEVLESEVSQQTKGEAKEEKQVAVASASQGLFGRPLAADSSATPLITTTPAPSFS